MNFLKYFVYSVIALALVGCSKDSIEETSGVGAVKMKTVTISSGIAEITRASVDSQTGAFAWQSGDLISILATDGKFYDFIINDGEAGKKEAEFSGSIPANENITTVATYPRIVSNGAANTILEGSTLNYYLPTTWTYAKDVSNVPMVAVFDEAAEDMAFKQVGGLMRFPVKNLPTEAKFVITMNKTITGSFPVNISSLGQSAMVAGDAASKVTINYTSNVDGASAEFNVPVPTGVYADFKVEILGANDEVLFSKKYDKSYEIKRATLFNMKELVMPERPMVIAEVWPFFVDARVVFNKYEGVTEYAFYIDGAETPVKVAAEDLDDKAGALIGGEFKHNTTHTVAVAKVVDGQVVADSKSEAVEFTTANVYQLTTNTGTKFVSAGWDDVAIGWGPKYDAVNKTWTTVSKALNTGQSVHYKRGYQVQLLAADKTTVIYDMIPFAGHEAFTGAFSDSSWIGKVGGNNALIPTALTFGYLEPGKDYYFRVKTLDEAVNIDSTNGNYNDGSADYPIPYPIYSERGGSAWSEMVKFSTDAAHVASANEILYEGFDDMMVNNDFMNWAVGVVPDLSQTPSDWDTYVANMPTTYPEFLKKSAAERKWTAQAFSKTLRVEDFGMADPWVSEVERTLNANAGSLEGWSVYGKDKDTRSVHPNFGAVRIGQSGSGTDGSPALITPAINSDKLLSEVATKCIVTANIGYGVTNNVPVIATLNIEQHRGGAQLGETIGLSVANIYPEEYQAWIANNNIDKNNYSHPQRYYEVKCEMYLKNGDILKFKRAGGKSAGYGMLIIGDIKIEVVPGEYEPVTMLDNGIGTEPDNTNYDVYGLGEFPISYWWTPPTAMTNNYDYETTKALYKDMADSGINIALYNGEVIQTLEENLRIMNICDELGMKFIGQLNDPRYTTNSEKIAAIKQHLATSPAYVGEYIADEPSAADFDELGAFTKEYLQEIPNKEIYINIFPWYASANQLGTSTYAEHVHKYFEKIPTKSLSFDYYGLHSTNNLKTEYYQNIDLVREKTLAKKMPFWVITQAGKVGTSTRMPNEKEQRWTVWSNIAGGSKGIAYFCYWDPWGKNNSDGNDVGMINRDGSKSDMYYWIQQINADINSIGKKLLYCHADGMISSTTTYYPLYSNNGQGRTKYGPIQKVSAVSNHVICGCFRDARTSENGDNYKGYKAMIVAQQPTKTIQTRLTLDSSVTAITVTQNNVTKVVELNNLTNVNVLDSENGIVLSYADGKLTLDIPEGEALLIEF